MKIGIDLGGSHIAIGVIKNNDCIIEKEEKDYTEENKKNLKIFIEKYIIDSIKKYSKKYEITEIGIAVPGTVNNGVILKCVNLNIENYDIAKVLKKEFNIPIKVRNDAKCAAIAESRIGTLKNKKSGIFLTLGTGIGGAVIINGKLLEIGDFAGCEFGHMVIEAKNGIKCNCGRKGCFEKYASMKVFKDKIINQLNLEKKTSGKEILEIIKNNSSNTLINNVLDEYVEYLGIGLLNLINIFEPEIISIGGSFVYFSEVLLSRLKKYIDENAYIRHERKKIIIVSAKLGNDAGIIGSC